MDIVFYEAEQFPPEYKGDAFVALKGSWNRVAHSGPKPQTGQPANTIDNRPN
jgi:glucose/arabinose dehydrogenase